MPFSELQRIARGKLESTQTKMSNCPADLVYPHDNQFMELVYGNGQISMETQSGRNRKNLSHTGISSYSAKAKDNHGGESGDAVIPKSTRFENMDAGLYDFQTVSGLCGQTVLGEEMNSTVPWMGNLSYPLDDTLQHDFCSEFFSELTGVSPNALDMENNAVQMIADPNIVSVQVEAIPERRNASMVGEADPETSRPSSHSQSKDGQSSIPSHRPTMADAETSRPSSQLCHSQSKVGETSIASHRLTMADPEPSRLRSQLCHSQSKDGQSSIPSHRPTMADAETSRPSSQLCHSQSKVGETSITSHRLTMADPEPSRLRSQLCHSQSKDAQSSNPSHGQKVPDFSTCSANKNNYQASSRNSNQTQQVSLANTKMQKHDPGLRGLPPNSMGLMNFSHFSRPFSVAKASLQNNVGGNPGPSLERLRSNEKISLATNKPAESVLIDLTSCSRNDAVFQSQPVSMPSNVDIKSFMGQLPKELSSAKPSGALCREGATRITILPDKTHHQNSNVAASTTMRKPDTEQDAEPVVTSSSFCSGNIARAASNDLKHILKRKSRETEETEYHSDDVEEESVDVRKPASARGGMGAKRSRAAEVHNLSERRRRDRINEKMRALQELIPNCNKVDKASMLDEAIEYLKTLQLQLQIMSMGNGLYMPQMMLPNGMQHMHPQHLPHFSPMGVGMGMGMGMGYGMGILDMSNGSSASPMMQFPMNGSPYPCPPHPGSSSFPPVAGSNLQMFGLPGQGLPMSMPRAPCIPPSEGISSNSVPAPDLPGTATPETPAPSSSSKDPKQKINTPMMHKTSVECSHLKAPQATIDSQLY